MNVTYADMARSELVTTCKMYNDTICRITDILFKNKTTSSDIYGLAMELEDNINSVGTEIKRCLHRLELIEAKVQGRLEAEADKDGNV